VKKINVVESSNCDSTDAEIARARRLTITKGTADKMQQKERKEAACVSPPTSAESGLR